jgi:ubiquinone/menaquinone biosynthesis C-methylase UbiE
MSHRAFWDRYLGDYDALNAFGDYSNYLDEMLVRTGVPAGGLVLDAGCGTGNFSLRLSGAGARVVGLDFSPVALAAYRRKDPGARVCQASLADPLPFRDGVFDCVVCMSVLFAIPESRASAATRELRRVLKPGGKLVITAMRPGQSRTAALWQHVKRQARALPWRDFLGDMSRTLPPLLRVLYHNWRMRGLVRSGGYRRLARTELIALVSAAGLEQAEYRSTFSGRFHLVEARAPIGSPRGITADRSTSPNSRVFV